jgi:hypothetical protein
MRKGFLSFEPLSDRLCKLYYEENSGI